jgi:hypothetical protein
MFSEYWHIQKVSIRLAQSFDRQIPFWHLCNQRLNALVKCMTLFPRVTLHNSVIVLFMYNFRTHSSLTQDVPYSMTVDKGCIEIVTPIITSSVTRDSIDILTPIGATSISDPSVHCKVFSLPCWFSYTYCKIWNLYTYWIMRLEVLAWNANTNTSIY